MMWNLRQQAKVSGFGALAGGTSTETDTVSGIDATTEEGLASMQARGLPVKMIPTGSI